MSEFDIRWQQRLANYSKALEQLGSAVSTSRQRSLFDLEKQGLIQAFEFTHELAWNVMKDYLAHNRGRNFRPRCGAVFPAVRAVPAQDERAQSAVLTRHAVRSFG